MHVARLVDEDGFACFQFVHLVGIKVERGLDDGPFGGKHHDFIVLVPKCRTYAPGVAHGEHLAAAGHSAEHVTAIPERRRGP